MAHDTDTSNSQQNLVFLVPDDQLQTVCELAAYYHLYPADTHTLRPVHPSEFADGALRYLVDDSPGWSPDTGFPRSRLVFLPLSWTSITRRELIPILAKAGWEPTLPCTVWTVPLPATCAAYVGIIAREKHGSPIRLQLLEGLSSVVGYSFFDMSYEGDYMEIPSDDKLSDKEILEIENAEKEMNGWVLRDDQEWIRQTLIQLVTGKKHYDDLPCQLATKM